MRLKVRKTTAVRKDLTPSEIYAKRQDHRGYHLTRNFTRTSSSRNEVADLAFEEFCLRREFSKNYYRGKIDERHWLWLGLLACKFRGLVTIKMTKGQKKDMKKSQKYYIKTRKLEVAAKAQEQSRVHASRMVSGLSIPSRAHRTSGMFD